MYFSKAPLLRVLRDIMEPITESTDLNTLVDYQIMLLMNQANALYAKLYEPTEWDIKHWDETTTMTQEHAGRSVFLIASGRELRLWKTIETEDREHTQSESEAVPRIFIGNVMLCIHSIHNIFQIMKVDFQNSTITCMHMLHLKSDSIEFEHGCLGSYYTPVGISLIAESFIKKGCKEPCLNPWKDAYSMYFTLEPGSEIDTREKVEMPSMQKNISKGTWLYQTDFLTGDKFEIGSESVCFLKRDLNHFYILTAVTLNDSKPVYYGNKKLSLTYNLCGELYTYSDNCCINDYWALYRNIYLSFNSNKF
jgi:hypothetical protein